MVEECEEPNCRGAVGKTWYGRKLCADHYEKYQEARDKQLWEMNQF